MGRIFSLPFTFRGKEYYVLVRDVSVQGETQLRVTVMNGELEKVLCGKNIFRYHGTVVFDEPRWSGGLCGELRLSIRRVLKRHLKEKKLGLPAMQSNIL